MDKRTRRKAILKIISNNEIESQHEIQKRLKRMGISAGQATISRDIRDLRLDKRLSESGAYCYFLTEDDDCELPYTSIFAQSVISIDYAMNAVVLKCHSGLADAACKVVDEQQFDSVVGTIAGDDTVFILTKSEIHAMKLIANLNRLMGC